MLSKLHGECVRIDRGALMQNTSRINLQAAKLINANVSATAFFAGLIFLYADIWRTLMTPFGEIPRDD